MLLDLLMQKPTTKLNIHVINQQETAIALTNKKKKTKETKKAINSTIAAIKKIRKVLPRTLSSKSNVPHAPSILEGVGPAVEHAIEMAMDLVVVLAALVQQRELEERPDVGALASERDEERDVGGVVLGALAVRVEVDRPSESPHREGFGGDVLADPHALGQGVALDLELVRPIHGLGARGRRGAR